ncbi:cation diffusion facilitator family transporter [Hoeflea sp. TYP-13]|uniref:cation diffusion facilitator family transporter n=1 Tax=Hoeflea sp. TYP-13 TaxID=3230023 RepID=UPI0034C6A0D0
MGHDHDHDHTHRANKTRVLWALAITAGFMVAEAVGGVIAGSLALIADAGHMLTDCVSLALAWFAFKIADKKPDLQRSYGYYRFQVLAAFVNGLSLFVIAVWITFEAVERIREPVHVLATPMLIIAALGLVANIVSFWILQSGQGENLNLRGAALHVLGDMLGSVAAIAAAIVIMTTGWTPIDPILSILVALLVLRAAWSIVKKSGHILLEGTPENVDPADLSEKLARQVPGVEDIHHVHIWSLTSEKPVLTMHAVVGEGADNDAVLAALQKALSDDFGIAHATIQLESRRCD